MGSSGCSHLLGRGMGPLRVRALSGMVAGAAMFAFQEGIAPSNLSRRYNKSIYVFATREEPHGQRPRVRSPEPRQRRHHVHRRPVSAAQSARVPGQHLYRLLLGTAARRVRQAPRGRRRARSDAELVILTDHNEPGQSVAGLENATIFGVVDHHRFGDFTTAAPLHIVALPWGSSCSIVAKLFEVMGVELTDTQAKLLLSAMMTDTLMLKSPTATDVDAAIAAKLGEQLGVDPVKFGMEVFLTRPSGSFTAAEMVGNDIKMFEVAGTKLLIGQYETVDKSRALGMIPEIREAMRAYQAEKAADGIVLCITDIMEEGSQVLLEGDTATAQKGLEIEDVAEGVWMPGVLSRKKQVAAPILAAN